MGDRYYAAFRQLCRFVQRQCVRETVLHADRADRRTGAFILAPTHVSHAEPMMLTCLLQRPIAWMARIEFFRIWPLGVLLSLGNSFAVNRQGVPVSAIRRAIKLARSGEIVGIFPEGGCRKGTQLAFRGGRIKQGVCTVAIRAGVPVVPVVILGTHAMNDIESWLPGRYRPAWIAFGHAIDPPAAPSRREQRRVRRAFAEVLERAYVQTYRELLDEAGLSDRMTP